MPQEKQKTRAISHKEYCPGTKIPKDIQEILMRQVQIEDELNHPHVPLQIPEQPKEKSQFKFTPSAAYAFSRTIIKQMAP